VTNFTAAAIATAIPSMHTISNILVLVKDRHGLEDKSAVKARGGWKKTSRRGFNSTATFAWRSNLHCSSCSSPCPRIHVVSHKLMLVRAAWLV